MQGELITFEVAGQLFGIDIMAVREIRAWTPTTPLPHAPDYVAGVVNLRGAVLPVINLAARLGWTPTEATARNAIIVVQLSQRASGLIVDSVSDIVTIDTAALQAPPVDSTDGTIPFISGLAPLGERMVMVLDLATFTENPPLAAAA